MIFRQLNPELPVTQPFHSEVYTQETGVLSCTVIELKTPQIPVT